MKTRITELFGIEYPIIQGGMAWVAEHHLAAAVSNAGGLGIDRSGKCAGRCCSRQRSAKAKKLTDKPFGVNIMLLSPYAEEVAHVVVEEGIKVVTTGAGNPGKYMEMLESSRNQSRFRLLHRVALAKMMQKARCGCGRCRGYGVRWTYRICQTTMTLVPQVVDAVDIPVIAAGGIADGRGFAAAMMLGAEAVQIGTRFCVATECICHENYKQKIIKAKDIDSEVTGRSNGHPIRCLRNQMSREYLRLEKEGAGFEELEHLTRRISSKCSHRW